MLEMPTWVMPLLLKATDWARSGEVTAGRVAGTVGVVALSVIAITNVMTYRNAVQWQAGTAARDAARAEQARKDMEAFQSGWTQRMIDAFREEEERQEAAREAAVAESGGRSEKRRMLERMARHRSSIINCTNIQPYILADLHQIPMYFNDDPEVMDAYSLLVSESGQTRERRAQMTEALFQSMARVTDSTDRFPPVPNFAPEFTIRCFQQ